MLAGTLQFLSEHSAQGLLEWLLPMLDVLVQGRVDERLVATAASLVHLALEPSQEIIIEPDGDPRLSLCDPDHRAPLRLAEVILLSHHRSSYCRRSAAVARRAEINRMRLPRVVQTTTSTVQVGPRQA